jgi:hypothetical protein
MATFTSTVSTNSTYVAKYVAGGSGDNIVPDGYIKAVEKVWVDTYTIAFTNTNTTVVLAELPPNKKILSIRVEIYTSASQTSGTIGLGYVFDAADCIAAAGVAGFFAPTQLTSNVTRTSIVLPGPGLIQAPTATSTTITCGVLAGFEAVTAGTATTIGLKLNNWTMTTGTIKSIVRYT